MTTDTNKRMVEICMLGEVNAATAADNAGRWRASHISTVTSEHDGSFETNITYFWLPSAI